MSYLIEYFCIKGGLVLLSVLHILITSTRRFWVWIFISPFFAIKASNVDSWSPSSILGSCLCTLSLLSFTVSPQKSKSMAVLEH